MLKRRIIYFVLLLFMVLFYILYSGVISFYCLLFCVAVPLISLLFTLPLGKKPEVILRLPERVECGGSASLYVSVAGSRLIPVSCMAMYFGYENEMTGSFVPQSRYDVYGCRGYSGNFPIATNECGRIKCDFPKVIIYDYTGLFRRVIKTELTLFMTVMPKPLPIEPRPVIPVSELTGIVYKPKRGGGFAEDYDIRSYRVGDPINLIHWKMTAKRRKPMVREPLICEHGRACITIDMFGNTAKVCRSLSRLYWLLVCLVNLHINSVTVWRDPLTHNEKKCEITSKTDIRSLFDELLGIRIAPNGETLEGYVIEGFVWQYHVSGREDVTL